VAKYPAKTPAWSHCEYSGVVAILVAAGVYEITCGDWHDSIDIRATCPRDVPRASPS
jgi:hypothetical protein